MSFAPAHETLVRLLDAATPAQLLDVAELLLPLAGLPLQRRDGPGDGGVDFRVRLPDGGPDPRQAVACSVERDWKKKLREDAQKALKQPELRMLTFVSSRRMPDAASWPVARELAAQGLTVYAFDAQRLASLAVEHGRWPELLGRLGLSPPLGHRPAPADLRRQWAFALAFLHPEAHALRQQLRELALCVALRGRPGPAPLPELVEPLGLMLGLPLSAAELGALAEGLEARGLIERVDGGWRLLPAEADRLDAVARAREAQAAALAAVLQRRLRAGGVDTSAATWTQLEPLLGRLLLPENVLATLRPAAAHPPLREAQALLEARGWSGGRAGLVELISEAAAHPYGQALRYGALARALHRLPAEGLSAALGAVGPAGAAPPRVVLDASVLMHLLCVWLHGDGPTIWDRAAARLRDLGRGGRLQLAAPQVWLEEAAAHLLDAHAYAPALPAAPLRELRGSRNAYVAAFAARGPSAAFPDLPAFLDGFADAAGARGDFDQRRRQVERELRAVLAAYGCAVIDTPAAEPERRGVAAERDSRFAASERPRITVDHDVQVIAWLHTASEAAGVVVLTWDNEVLDLCPEGRALDPVSFCDLAVALDPAPTAPLDGPAWSAELRLDPAMEARAAFWDALVESAGDRLHDAVFLQQARALRRRMARRSAEVQRAAARAFAMDA